MQKLVILGGGTAGWMAANMLNKVLKTQGFEVCLVESPQIGTIGVGEGSTPQLRQFFNFLEVDESEWMPQCNATYKNGISFNAWTQHRTANHYFHPFPSPFDQQTASAMLYHCKLRAQGMDLECHPNDFFLSSKLAADGRSPHTKSTIANIKLNYSYHFDSVLLGNFLAKKAIQGGVTHIKGTLKEVQMHTDNAAAAKAGHISALLVTESATEAPLSITGDFFVDASGFNSELLQKALGVGFKSFANNLFNDAAIAIPTDITEHYPTQTDASALQAGWAWKIPLQNRFGNGYVFSRRYTDFDTAEHQLKQHLKLTDLDVSAKRLHMKVGQVDKHWHKNVLAVGLSQGFIEPLEATALHLVQETLMQFLTHFKASKKACEYTDKDQAAFNDNISKRFEGIRDYIVCHYKLNTRDDSQYWIDNRNNTDISDNLAAVLEAWKKGDDINKVILERNMGAYYPTVSWYCLLAGYGYFSPSTTASKLPASQMTQIKQLIATKADLFERV